MGIASDWRTLVRHEAVENLFYGSETDQPIEVVVQATEEPDGFLTYRWRLEEMRAPSPRFQGLVTWEAPRPVVGAIT
mgnify:FL=1